VRRSRQTASSSVASAGRSATWRARAADPRVLLGGAIVAYAAGFGTLSVLRHRAFNTGRFDLGNMVQAVWSTAHGDPLEVTSLAGEQFVRLGAHFDPILVLFTPLWLLWPSPGLLVVVQAIAVALGALPVFWLGRSYLDSERAALGFALAYLLLPAVQWMTLSEFHPVALATPFLLFALWYLDRGRLVPFALFALLAVATKEHVGLALAGMGLWHLVSRRRLLPGAAVAAGGIAVTVLALGLVIPHFSPSGTSSFYGRYDDVGGSPGGMAKTAVTDPGAIVGAVSERRDAEYLAELVLPLAGLALLAPLALLVALPELGLNLLSATDTQTSIHFHYSATAIAGLVGASVFGAARLARRRAGLAEPLALVAVAAALASNYLLGGSPAWRGLPGAEQLGAHVADVRDHDRLAAEALRLIPGDAVVSASNSLGGHLSERRRVLSFPLRADAEWIAVDETQPSYGDRIGARADAPYAAAIARLRRDSAWELVHERDGVLVFRRVDES
jgi:uncharacterized membrane protein